MTITLRTGRYADFRTKFGVPVAISLGPPEVAAAVQDRVRGRWS